MNTRRRFFASVLIACAAITSTVASAQEWPSKTINLIVTFPPGGASDAAARLIAERLTASLGRPVVIDNRAGVSGVLGTQIASKAPGDGYTLVLTSAGPFAFAPSTPNMKAYDPVRDFAQVAMLGSIPLVFYVNNDLPVRSVADLVSLAKSKPGDLNFGSSGPASPSHMMLERFKMKFNLDIVNVSTRGTGTTVIEIMAGRVQGSIDSITGILPNIKAGKLRALAVTTPQRSPQLPDVPTIAEAGYPDLEAASWFGIAVPASTPKEIVTRLNKEIVMHLQSPEIKTKFGNLGFVTHAWTPDEVTNFINSEVVKWKPIVEATKITFGN